MTSSADAQPSLDEAASSAAAVGPARPVRRPRDMAISLAVLVLPILLIIGVGRFFYGDTTTATKDPSLALSAATRAGMAPLPLATPPSGWKIVSASFQQGVLRIGYLTPRDRGVELVEALHAGASFVTAELTSTGHSVGELSIAGSAWQRWTGRAGESALVRTDRTATSIVVGEVDESDLAALAVTLP